MNYDWDSVVPERTVEQHRQFIERVEDTWLTDELAFERVADNIDEDNEFREEVVAATYLVSQSLYPNVRIDEVANTLTEDLDLESLELTVYSKTHRSVFMPPREYLRKIHELFDRQEYHWVRCELANIPRDLRWNRQTPTVLGLAIYRALNVDLKEVCERYLNGKTSPETVKRLRDDIEDYPDSRERGIEKIESEHDGELRDAFSSCSLDSIRLAVDLESAIGVQNVFSRDDVDTDPYDFGGLDDLLSAGILEKTEDGYMLTQSCFC